MSKKEIINTDTLVELIGRDLNLPRYEVESVLKTTILHLVTELRNNKKVRINGLGTFDRRERVARIGVNPQNPTERIKIPAVNVIKFTASSTLKEQIK